MEQIFNFSIPKIEADFLEPSFDQIRKGNLLRIYLKEIVIYKMTEKLTIEIKQLEDAKNKFFKENKLLDNDRLNQFLLFKGINEKITISFLKIKSIVLAKLYYWQMAVKY